MVRTTIVSFYVLVNLPTSYTITSDESIRGSGVTLSMAGSVGTR